VPLLNLTVKGAVWYQGEANSGDPTGYACMFPAMIADWRVKFRSELPFFFVELAAYPDGGGAYPAIRWAQTAALQLPNVGMATAIDLGDPDSPAGSIHPRNKSEVGRRLSLQALDIVYGHQLVSQGPTPRSFAVAQSAGSYLITVQFSTSGALKFNGTQYCKACCSAGNDPFEVLDSSTGKWVQGTSSILSSSPSVVFVKVTLSGKPSGVRFDWADYPQCGLFDTAADLAAPPFTHSF